MSVLEAPAKTDRNDHANLNKLIAKAQAYEPAKTAIAHPCDQVSLESAVEAARLGLIVPILVGPKDRIQEVAKAEGRH